MAITKDNILDKTHYGLNIYAYVLRQFKPGEVVLKLSGRECAWIKNPFTNSKTPTLMIRCINNVFLYEDNEIPDFKGDPFDFAELYFKISGDELLAKLNECLNLYLDKKRSFYGNGDYFKRPVTSDISREVKPTLVIPVFSYFKRPVTNTQPANTVNILDVYQLIKGMDFKKATEKLRSIKVKDDARKFKAHSFDYVTFSGTFGKREDKSLIKHSGLMTIDFDHVANIERLKADLLKDEYFETELLFVSPSGEGLKWIIPVDLSEYSHAEYFEAIQNYIWQTYHLQIDKSGRDISRACFLGYDNNIFINPKYIDYAKQENV
ncbi:MAG: VirE protein [Bacteroidetes bacterium HGW-Bacteroidetes-17]|jgi:hypothetical protein|nr:MAG: VirE protein [Bacteroidetes bacterium HGW-Bacteroidetes-17]